MISKSCIPARVLLAGLLAALATTEVSPVLPWFGCRVFAGDPPRIQFESGRFAEIADEDEDPMDPALQFTDIGNLKLYLSNAGTFGNGFSDKEKPAMEWPANSAIDHMVRGAVWVGAVNAATGETHVTTGGRDAYYLDPIFQHSEFTPVAGRPREFSRLRTSPFFKTGTVSDEHFRTAYVDSIYITRPGTAEPPHVPLDIRVLQNTYSWGFDPVDDFVIVELNVINVGEAALLDVWIGIYSELVTNNREAFPRWPPGGTWFDFQDLTWDADRRMLANHNDRPRRGATSYGAIKLLGSGGSGPFGRGPDSIATKEISLTTWSWSPSQFLTWSDSTLYSFMSRGKTDFPEGIPDPGNTEINPVTILSVGPFAQIAPGDTTQLVLAFLAGEDPADLERNAFWAQKAYDDKYALPSPPSPPIMRVFPRHREVVVRWSAEPESEIDPASKLKDFQGYRLYLSDSPLAASYRLVHEYDISVRPDGTPDDVGFNTGLDAIRLPTPYITDEGDTLRYQTVLPNIPDGFKRYFSITSYDYQEGDPKTLETGVLTNSVYFIAGPDRDQAHGQRVSVFPNPYRGESQFDVRDATGTINPRKRVLWFVNLPAHARIRIYTLAGDLVREFDFNADSYTAAETGGVRPDRDDLAIGRNVVTSGSMHGFDLLNADGQEISSGLYLFSVRDKITGETQQGKFMVIR